MSMGEFERDPAGETRRGGTRAFARTLDEDAYEAGYKDGRDYANVLWVGMIRVFADQFIVEMDPSSAIIATESFTSLVRSINNHSEKYGEYGEIESGLISYGE